MNTGKITFIRLHFLLLLYRSKFLTPYFEMDHKTENQIHVKEYLNTLNNYHATLPWFLLSNDIGINLISTYINEFRDNDAPSIILSLYLMCKDLLANPVLANDTIYTQRFLALIPEEIWKKQIENEINSFSTDKNKKFDLIIDYKRYLYHRFKVCDLFQKFEEHVRTRSNHLTKLLSKLYNIHRYQNK